MASNNVHPQGVPRFARLNAVGALVLDIELEVPVLNMADQTPVSVVSES